MNMRIKEARNEKGLFAREVAEELGMDEGTYSKIETYKVLPIPSAYIKLVTLLGGNLYRKSEVDLVGRQGRKTKEHIDGYKLTVRLHKDMCKCLTPEVLNKCGYGTVTGWARACAKRLGQEYEHMIKSESKKG
jgi:transcriptional regulator with XRE-family HTH domain